MQPLWKTLWRFLKILTELPQHPAIPHLSIYAKETEILIQKALNELCVGRTTIVVAHRLSTIKNADEIAVVAHGKILEKGSHDALLEKNGAYKKLYDAQFTTVHDQILDIEL